MDSVQLATFVRLGLQIRPIRYVLQVHTLTVDHHLVPYVVLLQPVALALLTTLLFYCLVIIVAMALHSSALSAHTVWVV